MGEKKFNKIDCKELRLGMRFSAPVFFDDGENMFLGEEKAIKNYHIDAIQRWNIEYLLTYGHLVNDGKNQETPESLYMLEDLEEVEEL
ncbi:MULTISPECIES: phosphohydrolase [unclassified Treponema]|uniref:phosphohydrolase n=1 Tax=unclassified Treponema TaxID=2638727 RepID=UPI001B1CA34B|nr:MULTISPECIES: phosphohydrolase [unclassified Treponema]MBO6219235.1 phosphohydrolase [Treponema sp.]MBQ8680759.1 phosphohydrolase [Treponema sp.]